jgi:hypothetical protein
MEKIELETQMPEPIDEATAEAIRLADAQIAAGQALTLEESRKLTKKQYEEWLKVQNNHLSA